MAFVPNTNDDRKKMLDFIGVASFDELIKCIPEEIRFKGDLKLPAKLSEMEVITLLEGYSQKNKAAGSVTSFLGAGAYDIFTPSLISTLTDRSEFKTAYTPYQAEVSQGTLQAMYEFQSMIASLTSMDVANASLYDGGTSLAEAALMTNAHTRKTEFIIAGSINPTHYQVLKTETVGRKLTFIDTVNEDGTCDLEKLKAAIGPNTAGVIVQQPNFYGTLEEVEEIEKITHTTKALFIVSVDPISLGIIKSPGEYNADIVVGEGQSLGIPLSFGGPYLGLFATKSELIRKIPGRLAGVTQDTDGQRGFVLTLQTREQQIKREKATSNICTNQGLFMLTATIYMSMMGKEGIKQLAEQSYHKAHYLAEKICQVPGFKMLNDKPFFREFFILTEKDPNQVLLALEAEGIMGGINASVFPGGKKGLLIAVTEKRTRAELDKYVEIISK